MWIFLLVDSCIVVVLHTFRTDGRMAALAIALALVLMQEALEDGCGVANKSEIFQSLLLLLGEFNFHILKGYY